MPLPRLPLRSIFAWGFCVWVGLGMTVSDPNSLRHVQLPEPSFKLGNQQSVAVRDVGNGGEAGSFGIDFHPKNTSIMAQAVAGILTQALYEAYVKDGLVPNQYRRLYDFPYVENGIVPPAFSVGISMEGIGNQTGDYALTNRRIVTVLSLMGFNLAHEKDLNSLKEYAFDVVVKREGSPQVIIARGSLTNYSPPPSPTATQ